MKGIIPQVGSTYFEQSTNNQLAPRHLFHVTKSGKGTNKRKATHKPQSELRIAIGGWNMGRIPASILAQAAELSKQSLNACTRNLSPEKLQENRQKPWDQKKPYSCPLMCGKA